MDIEKSAEALTGMALDQAVVRVKWTDALINQWAKGHFSVLDSPSFNEVISTGDCETEPEAWANAADRVIEAEYDVIETESCGWAWGLKGNYVNAGHDSRALALESAKRDYVRRNMAKECLPMCGFPEGHAGECGGPWYDPINRTHNRSEALKVLRGIRGFDDLSYKSQHAIADQLAAAQGRIRQLDRALQAISEEAYMRVDIDDEGRPNFAMRIQTMADSALRTYADAKGEGNAKDSY